MEPVISPWLFYLIELADGLKLVFGGLGFAIGIVLILSGQFDGDCAYDENVKKKCRKKKKIGLAILLIGCFVCVLIPSSDTLVKMAIAKNVTYDTVDAAKDVVNQVYNDILALFQK
jgi:hypothetical protein